MGCPDISSGMAVLRDRTLVLAMAAVVVALELPSLETRWITRLDDACVWGLMEIPGEDDLLVHGEMDIRRLGMDGAIRWRRGGADIFTGGCWLEDGVAVAVDWIGATYRWRLSDGEPLSVEPGRFRESD